jgi:hypothetical protein
MLPLSDVEIHHLETAHQLEFSRITLVANGPIRAAVKAQVKYGKSTINVTVSLLLLITNWCSLFHDQRFPWMPFLVSSY